MPGRDESTPETRRLTADEIFNAAVENARSELRRSSQTLAFSGVAGGLTLGLSGLAVSAIQAMIGTSPWALLVSYFIYPVGFIAVIIGRAQLFTENTLYPVVLVLDEHRYFRDTVRLWGVVFSANIVGAFCFALLATKSEAVRPEIISRLVDLGSSAANGTVGSFFWSGIIGGWLIALVAWVVTAAHWTIGQLAMVWLLTFVVGVGRFSHCIVTSGEILSAVLSGALPAIAYLRWLAPATLGNIVGGVVMGSLLNYGQVREV